MGLISRVIGGPAATTALGQAVTGVAEVFTPNATKRMEAAQEAYLAALDEHGHHEKSSDDSPHAADLLRIDLKVNLLLDLVGALLAATQSRPSPVPARFNPHGIVWEASGEVPPAGAYGLVEIHLRDCLVQPLALAGTVADEPAEHHVHVRFDPLPEPVADQLERLVFRRHRRQVAGGRTQRRV